MNKEEIEESIKFFREHIQAPFTVNSNNHCFNINLEGWGIFRVDYLNETMYYPDSIRYINGEPRTFCYEYSKIKPTNSFDCLHKKHFETKEDILKLLDELYIEAKKAKQIELEHQVMKDFK